MGERECRNCGPTVAVSVTFPTNNWCGHLCWPNSPDGTVLLRPNVQLPTAIDRGSSNHSTIHSGA